MTQDPLTWPLCEEFIRDYGNSGSGGGQRSRHRIPMPRHGNAVARPLSAAAAAAAAAAAVAAGTAATTAAVAAVAPYI